MNIGYKFKNKELLEVSLAYRSNNPEIRNRRQRLEFLGDRVLSFILSRELLNLHEKEPVGFLVAKYNNLVNNQRVEEIARDIGLGQDQEIGHKALADCCEALIGAIFLDGGLEPAKKFILDHWEGALLDDKNSERDAKSLLQELSQKTHGLLPQYTLTDEAGADHSKWFVVEVKMGEIVCSGSGTSKKNAEQEAAEALLRKVELLNP